MTPALRLERVRPPEHVGPGGYTNNSPDLISYMSTHLVVEDAEMPHKILADHTHRPEGRPHGAGGADSRMVTVVVALFAVCDLNNITYSSWRRT